MKASELSSKKITMEAKEIVLWATKIGEENWKEQIITTCKTSEIEKLNKAMVWAVSNGFSRLRTNINNLSEIPNFSKTIIE